MPKEIAKGQSVFHNGQFYVAGQEAELDRAMKGETRAGSVKALTESGVISGFGVASPKEADLEDDPTLVAAEDEEVMKAGGEMRAEISPVEARPGAYTAEQGRKPAPKK